MKLFEFLQHLTEDRLDYFAKQQKDNLIAAASADQSLLSVLNPKEAKDSKAIITKLAEADPTPTNKYIEYIIKMYLNNSFHFEDAQRMNLALSSWHQFVSRIPVVQRELRTNPDTQTLEGLEQKAMELHAYYSKEDEENTANVNDVDQSKQEKKLSKTQAHQNRAQFDGLTILLSGPDGTAYHATNQAACLWATKAFGKTPYSDNPHNNATWCTKTEYQFNHYTAGDTENTGPIYIFNANGETAFQIHLETGQVRNPAQLGGRDIQPRTNETADELGFNQASKYPTFRKFWKGLMNYHIIPAILRGKYQSAIKYTKISNKRFPEIEKEILKSPDASLKYADEVIKGRWKEAEPTIMTDPASIERYALRYFKGERWYAAEPFLLQNTQKALAYSNNAFKTNERWPELENAILTNKHDPTTPQTAKEYAIQNKQRWREAEPVILRNLDEAQDYYEKVYTDNSPPERRWPEFESALLKSNSPRPPLIYMHYTKDLFPEGRWPELEEIVLQKPGMAVWYAVNILKNRWLEAEDIIKSREDTYQEYKIAFGIK